MKYLTRRGFMRIATAAAATAGIASLTSCAPQQNESASVVVILRPEAEPTAGFDPLSAWGCGHHLHDPLIQSTLIKLDANMEFKGDLAMDFGVSDDGLSWTFVLPDEATFSNGQPITAQDVVFSIEGVRDSTEPTVDLSAVDWVEALENKVVIHLSRPYTLLPHMLCYVGIVPSDSYDALSYGTSPIGSGRYMLQTWERGKRIVFKANPRYYGEPPRIQTVTVEFASKKEACAACFAGTCDIAFTDSSLANQSINAYTLFDCTTTDTVGISLPCAAESAASDAEGNMTYAGNAVTSDVAIRRALWYMLDRSALVKEIMKGYGAPAYSVAGENAWANSDVCLGADVGKAQQLLEDAGWKRGQDGIWVKDGRKAAFDLYCPLETDEPAGDDGLEMSVVGQNRLVSLEVARQAAKGGIAITVKPVSGEDIASYAATDPVLMRWGSVTPCDLYGLNHSQGWGNVNGYADAAVDAHLDDALQALDTEEQDAQWRAAQWDGKTGLDARGKAPWLWIARADHLFFKCSALKIPHSKPLNSGSGWSLLDTVHAWSWDEES